MKSQAMRSWQFTLPGLQDLDSPTASLANADTEARGAIFTRQEVVNFILDLIGYTPDKPLFEFRLLEPSFGRGDFILPVIDRLLSAYLNQKKTTTTDLVEAIRAVELHADTFCQTKSEAAKLLSLRGLSPSEITQLIDAWFVRGDFLLTDISKEFTHVVGNPPYVRQELIPEELMGEYRRRYSTIYDRADLYVPFIERSLSLLQEEGVLGFVCADRWMKNRYGGPLRQLVADHYCLQAYVDLQNVPAFHEEVMAYPAIFVIGRNVDRATRVAQVATIEREGLALLAKEMVAPQLPEASHVRELAISKTGTAPWLFEAVDDLALLRRLEETFPSVEEVGCRVGIGVATGADRIFIQPYDDLDVEADRKLPLIMTGDIHQGNIKWGGSGVINPFSDGGGLVSLSQYPRLKRFLESHRADISRRHVAKKSPANWYRTIDRIYPDLLNKPKLLIPDIKGRAQVVYDEGNFYPHHNLYYVVSDEWDLRALQAVLTSDISHLFVSSYSTKMRGGYLRFQAQYLRRIRLPRWSDVPDRVRKALLEAGGQGDVAVCNEVTATLYDLTPSEKGVMKRFSAI